MSAIKAVPTLTNTAKRHSLLVCGEPARNGLGGNRLNIDRFLRLLQNAYPFIVAHDSRNGEDCYTAEIIFTDNVSSEELEEFFSENQNGETWTVQASIFEKFA